MIEKNYSGRKLRFGKLAKYAQDKIMKSLSTSLYVGKKTNSGRRQSLNTFKWPVIGA